MTEGVRIPQVQCSDKQLLNTQKENFPMRIAVNIGPTGDWSAMLAAAKVADALGFDALGFLDHYHSDEPGWQTYICGWSAYGALAMATSRIHLTPMVIDRLNYLPGVLAKEVATLSILSNGRFELGIGAGDYFEEARAWGTPVPRAPQRISGLRETIQALRRIWRGEIVTFEGEHLRLKDAAVTPTPPTMPRVVVGAGSSRSLIQSAIDFADEINVYADDDLIRFARQTIEAAQRPVALSAFVWDWLDDIEERLLAWEKLGVARTFVTFWHPFDKLPQLAKLL
jgi:alkanesulfonate monooxygenase SsuD/methylene tetrahydromethanopterin reductase-like flavin-dependent oxidoreductase (luciferase family)